MPDYQANDPRGWCGDPTRGAALGRPSAHVADYAGRLYLRRAYLDCGGYDRNGTYFGHGAPLYWCASDCGAVDFMLRADTRHAARAEVLGRYPLAKVKP